MRTRLEQVLERYLNGREIAVWGTPTRRLLRVLQGYNWHVADIVDPSKHYVVSVNNDDDNDFEQDEQSKAFYETYDCTNFADEGGELPFEWECHGVPVGRQTYLSQGIVAACRYGFVERIGHFTSINGSADIGCDHQMDMVTTSDDIEHFCTIENRAKFIARHKVDPKHPYAQGKPKITIGNDVWIGANAFINSSKVTSIGDGAIIGAGAVVLEDVPSYAVVVGVPAKVKRYRFTPEMIEVLQRVQWWHWSQGEINANIDTLLSPEEFMERFGHE
ncbi:MAG: CatB-related O-acetyltransferase [Oscillospiraceae bacterium]|nr:CatB-related O-acetyltransferase [Oscillospiraceae bacterium]